MPPSSPYQTLATNFTWKWPQLPCAFPTHTVRKRHLRFPSRNSAAATTTFLQITIQSKFLLKIHSVLSQRCRLESSNWGQWLLERKVSVAQPKQCVVKIYVTGKTLGWDCTKIFTAKSENCKHRLTVIERSGCTFPLPQQWLNHIYCRWALKPSSLK